MKRKWWVVVLLLGGAAVTFMALRGRGEKLPEVTVEAVAKGELVSKVAANGRVEAKSKVDISANVMGQIVDLRVKEGDKVQKGDLLLQIDQTQLAASAAGAEASVKALRFDREAALARAAEAKQAHERAQRSRKQDLIPQSEVDRAQAAWTSAQAEIAAIERRIDQAVAGAAGARDSLAKTHIEAPIAGTVTRLPVEAGEVAVVGTMNNAGTVLMTISDLSVVEAVMEVDETDIPSVALGQEASVTIDAYTNRTFKGTVTEIGSSPIQKVAGMGSGDAAVNFEVKIQLAEPPDGVRPGFSCSAEIQTGRREAALAVPIQALVVRDKSDGKSAVPDDEEGVYVYDGSVVHFKAVKTGITGETKVEITTGLEEGTKIVTGPFKALREIKEGARVREKVETAKSGPGGDEPARS